jgi:hypothetical protein
VATTASNATRKIRARCPTNGCHQQLVLGCPLWNTCAHHKSFFMNGWGFGEKPISLGGGEKIFFIALAIRQPLLFKRLFVQGCYS